MRIELAVVQEMLDEEHGGFDHTLNHNVATCHCLSTERSNRNAQMTASIRSGSGGRYPIMVETLAQFPSRSEFRERQPDK